MPPEADQPQHDNGRNDAAPAEEIHRHPAVGDGPEDILALQQSLDDANQQLLRIQAELENYRKRAQREMQQERKYAALPLVRDLLPALDNLGRAIQSADDNEGSAGLLAGVKMVHAQLHNVLAQHQCQPIETAGQAFDPNLHEALGEHPSAEHAAGEIAIVAQQGYQLHERVVHPSQVFLSSGPPSDEQST